jgi:uncharacterized protein YifE (UPF0438 family)
MDDLHVDEASEKSSENIEEHRIDSRFELHSLPHFPHLFTQDELEKLARWGVHAQALSNDSIVPKSDGERIFQQVVLGLRPPEKNFHRLWLLYTQAVAAEVEYQVVVGLRATIADDKAELERLLDDVRRLNTAHRSAWNHANKITEQLELQTQAHSQQINKLRLIIAEYENKLGISKPSSINIDQSGWVDEWREQK